MEPIAVNVNHDHNASILKVTFPTRKEIENRCIILQKKYTLTLNPTEYDQNMFSLKMGGQVQSACCAIWNFCYTITFLPIVVTQGDTWSVVMYKFPNRLNI